MIYDNRQRIDDTIRADRQMPISVVTSNCRHDAVQRITEDLVYRKVSASLDNTFFERQNSGILFRNAVQV